MAANYLGIYYVSKQGNVWNVVTGNRIKVTYDASLKEGYYRVRIGSKRLYIHRILAEIYLPIPNQKKMVVDHINGDRLDNRLSNLQWVTHSENIKLAYHRKKKGLC